MKQLTQKLRNGAIEILELPVPSLQKGQVLVRNHFSLISAGTEGGTVRSARKSLVGKAKERPAQVKQVIDTLAQQGVVQTYRAVSKKLDSYSPLGYSSAGIVIDVASDVRSINVGDRVACAGAGYASHAEVVAVPENLCVPVPPDADLAQASYNTIGAIAMQGVRNADLRLGETCLVIGLGLIGQITCLLLRASGVTTIGLDVSDEAVSAAKTHCADYAFLMSDPCVADEVRRITSGIYADAAIITAATSSLQPINLAGALARQRGTIVIVGDVPTGFEREPHFYKKELSVKMSCSYGPGRYDLNYEEKGFDYPPGYVRWTENRNMRAFQRLLAEKKIDLNYMTTHRFSIDDAADAYDLILGKEESYLGIMIEYDVSQPTQTEPIKYQQTHADKSLGQLGIAFVGAGSYAMSHLLPNLPRAADVKMTGVLTVSGTSSRSVAEKFGFRFSANSIDDILADEETNTIFVATRHDSHFEFVKHALTAGKNVFVEKPICLLPDQLDDIVSAWRSSNCKVMVGFNRRFSPLVSKLKLAVGDGPMSMLYRVNAGKIPSGTWIQDIETGGGRILGEICHFIDFLIFLNGSLPRQIFACVLPDAENLDDTVSINICFANGSIGTISYFANGPKNLEKEYIEVYKDGVAGRIIDFRKLELYRPRGVLRKSLLSQNKGQKEMVRSFVDSLKSGKSDLIPFIEIVAGMSACFAVLKSLKTRSDVEVELPDTLL